MGIYDINPLLDMLKEKAKEKPEKYNIFICGPSYGDSSKKPNNKLRVYAYGGVLCELPTDRTGSNGKITPPAKKYSPLLENLNGLRGNGEREKFLEANLDCLMDAMEHRFTSTKDKSPEERNQQTIIARTHTDFSQHDGTVVCDFQFAVPREYGCEGKKLPIFDLVTFSMNKKTGGGVFTLVEYKCSAKACEGEEGESGLRDHAADMLNCMKKPAASDWCKKELLRRLGYMRDYGLLQHWPKELELEHLSSGNIKLQAAFLFTPGDRLQSQEDAAALCSEYIPEADLGEFSYCFAKGLESVNLSDMRFWKTFPNNRYCSGGTKAMWEYLELPAGSDGPGELLVEQCVTAKMREYDGTVFLCCAPGDQERIETFTRSAQAAGKEAIFVQHTQQEYLNDYLSACSTGERHLVIYSRRRGNGPSPHMSAFLGFWLERDVDIWDLRDIDNALKAGERP